MNSYATRPAIKSDADELARLFRLLRHQATGADISARWESWLAAGNLAIVAAETEDALIGAVTLGHIMVLHRPLPIGRITLLVVDEAFRGRGIGRELVSAAEATLAQRGCGMLEITSNLRFVGAHAFYEHLGYQRTSHRFVKSLTAGG